MPQSAGDKKYKRILLKLSGEALTGQENFGIDPKILDQLALEVGQLVGIGVRWAWWWVAETCFAARRYRLPVSTGSPVITWVCWPP